MLASSTCLCFRSNKIYKYLKLEGTSNTFTFSFRSNKIYKYLKRINGCVIADQGFRSNKIYKYLKLIGLDQYGIFWF